MLELVFSSFRACLSSIVVLCLVSLPDVIVKSKKRATQRSSGQHQCEGRSAKDGILSLPYISEVTHWVRKAVRKSGLNIHTAQVKSIMTQSALEPLVCPNQRRCMACQADLRGRCTMKNVIYKLDCTLCTKSYVGEMKRPIRERLLEHRRAALNRHMQNPWRAHYGTEHNREQVPEICQDCL